MTQPTEPGADLVIRPATRADDAEIVVIVEPVIRAGETYAIERDLPTAGILDWWFAPGHSVFVADLAGAAVGTYYLQANQRGPGAHVANCGYITAAAAAGRGVARAMCADSLDRARAAGFRAMQFNLVVSTNSRAVRLWQSLGFAIVGTIPLAFDHARLGPVDAHVMHRML